MKKLFKKISQGTYACFSDSETESSLKAGTLDLSAESTEVIDIDDIKTGDSMIRNFELKNEGSLDIKSVTLDTDYDVDDADR